MLSWVVGRAHDIFRRPFNGILLDFEQLQVLKLREVRRYSVNLIVRHGKYLYCLDLEGALGGVLNGSQYL